MSESVVCDRDPDPGSSELGSKDRLLRLMAAGPVWVLVAASIAAVGCSQPRGEGPKTSGDIPKAEVNGSATPAPPATENAASSPGASGGMLAAGTEAPDLQGKDANGQPVRLHDRRGKVSIVYFYPKDGTPGCTKEACAFRDTFDRFNRRGVTIFGVSRDDEASHAKFRAEHSLPFPLVADPEGTVQKAYGVPDKLPGLAARVTFLVAADGRIAKVWPDVDPAVHADEVFQAIEALK